MNRRRSRNSSVSDYDDWNNSLSVDGSSKNTNTVNKSNIDSLINTQLAIKKYRRKAQERVESDFHRTFKISWNNERVLDVFSCALKKDILLQGKLYLTQYRLCFYSSIFGYETTVTINYTDICEISKQKTALLFPNALLIRTQSEKYLFQSIISRESAYRILTEMIAARTSSLNMEDGDRSNDSHSSDKDVSYNQEASTPSDESLRVPINDRVYAEVPVSDGDETAFYHNPHFHDLSRSRITSRLEKSSRGIDLYTFIGLLDSQKTNKGRKSFQMSGVIIVL
ncbi:uncharacterized protein TRIADDRAFT_54487 [Trichoplax adhaerens]|uniref:GRAM domain-containing protein n=1 Tax=Trichoplax adhaerens TaxID=10228 RepID=B3RS64_TRIAD|nr:hypothetical protein TRIADDRAFT_54487 [Trichoplax adhaerens]EDV27001.1 hypothetical protein TRIADDRAFT_54487 [Trichoplax adhaerens]|eukprot:XP_002110997.1 hypothetical protein TRIADDRAFT_54487 [Trichoplax adhaerens]